MTDTENKILEKVIANEALVQMKTIVVANEKLGVAQVFERKKYDNVYYRKKYKIRSFDGKKTQEDYITGRRIHLSSKATLKKYRKFAYTRYTSDTDHIVPIRRVYGRLNKNPFLSDGDIKRIANADHNLRVASSNMNRQKGDKTNFEYAVGNVNLTLEQKSKLIADGTKADVSTFVHATALTARNVGVEFVEGAVNSVQVAAIPLMIEGVHNIILVANGEKEFGEAIKDMRKITTQVAVSGGTIKTVTTGLTNTLKNSGVEVFSKIANSNQFAQIITVAIIVKDSIFKYINGEIDGKQFFEEIGQKGIEMISGSIGFIAGQMLIPIPVVGGLIGSFLISTVCGEIYKVCCTLNQYKEREVQVRQIAEEALSEMKRQQEVLTSFIKEEYSEWDKRFDDGLSSIYSGILNSNIDMITSGLDNTLSIFGKKATFRTYTEFDNFFNDEEAVFVL